MIEHQNSNPLIIVALAMALLSGCVPSVDKGKSITTVDLRAMQTREFACPKKAAIESVAEMFQDLGLVVDQLNPEYGIIGTKNGPLNFKPTKDAKLNVLGLALPIPGEKSDTGQGSATVKEIGENRVSIRVVFNKISTESTTTQDRRVPGMLDLIFGYGATTTTNVENNTVAITDPDFYKAVFAKVEKSIFLKLNQ